MLRRRAGLVAAACAAVAAARSPAATPERLFADAAIVPGSASVMLRIEEPMRLREDPAARDAAAALLPLVAGGELPQAWGLLSDAAGLDAATAFDAALGAGFTIVARSTAHGWDWAAVLDLGPRSAGALLARWNPRRLLSRHGLETVSIPELDLRGWLAAERCVLAPDRDGGIGDEVAAMLAAGGERRDALGDDAAMMTAARALGRGAAALLVRHDAPLGGWSASVAELADGRLLVRHRSSFGAAPFDRPPTRLEIDPARLGTLESRCAIAIVEPTDIGATVGEAWLESVLGAPLMSPPLRRLLGARQYLAVAEATAPDGAGRLLRPSVAFAFEVGDPREALRLLDRQFGLLAASLNDRMPPGAQIAVPASERHPCDEVRSIDLSPLDPHLAGDQPLLRGLSLCWTATATPDGGIAVVATDATFAAAVADGLAHEGDRLDRPLAHWDGCGTIDGPRLAEQLRSWSELAPSLARDEPGAADELRRSLDLLSGLSERIARCRWTLRRPTERDLELEIEAIPVPQATAKK